LEELNRTRSEYNRLKEKYDDVILQMEQMKKEKTMRKEMEEDQKIKRAHETINETMNKTIEQWKEALNRQKQEFEEKQKEMITAHSNELAKMNRKYRHSAQLYEIDLENVKKSYDKEINQLQNTVKELANQAKSQQSKDKLIDSLQEQIQIKNYKKLKS